MARNQTPSRMSITWMKARKNWRMYALMSPYLLLFVVFTVLPVLCATVLALPILMVVHPVLRVVG